MRRSPRQGDSAAQGAIDAARAAARISTPRGIHGRAGGAEACERSRRTADYRLALNHALDSRERAQNAAKRPLMAKAVARVDADRALTAATAALNARRSRQGRSKRANLRQRRPAPLRNAIAVAEQRVQEARAAFTAGDYATATSTASAVPGGLSVATRAIDTGAAGTVRRRRGTVWQIAETLRRGVRRS